MACRRRNRYAARLSWTKRASADRAFFSVAAENEKLTVNPTAKIKRKAEHNDRIRFLADDEDAKLIKVLSKKLSHYLPVFLISTHTGMPRESSYPLSGLIYPFPENRLSNKDEAGKDAPHSTQCHCPRCIQTVVVGTR